MPPLSKVEVKVFINKVRLPTSTPKNVEIFNDHPILFAESLGVPSTLSPKITKSSLII